MIETIQGVWGAGSVLDADLAAVTGRVAELPGDRSGARRVVQTAKARLKQNLSLWQEAVCCEFRGGILSLYGRLPTFYQKQVAQESVRGLEGVRQVVNHIEVAS